MGVKFPLIFMANPFEALEAALALQSDEILELSFDEQPVKDEVKRLQTEVQMLEQGLNANGERMGSYSPLTKKIKIAEGKISQYVTGLDTGEMYNSTTVTTDAAGINIFINTQKPDGDFEDHGYGSIAGLTKENTNELAEFALPYVNETAREILGLR